MQQQRTSTKAILSLPAALAILVSHAALLAQCAPNATGAEDGAQIQQLVAQHNWAEVVRLAKPISPRSPDFNFDLGIALAHLSQWPAARAAFMDGARQCPRQKRFPIELAGVAFEQKRNPEAAVWLRRGLKLDPGDSYANNFAGTVYYLMGNLDAALKYWNRIQKPYIAALHFDPQLHVQRLILDRAFVFSPAAVLNQAEYEATEARLESLGIFPSYNIVLNARPDGNFDADFHAIERDGFGSSRMQAIVSTFAGAVYETVYPSYFNIRGSDTNLESRLRWDTQKRRAWLSVSAPLHARPQLRWRLSADARDENWAIRSSFTGVAPPLGSLNLERQTVTGSVLSISTARLQWSTAAELSHRSYRDISYGTALTPQLVSPGFELKYVATVEAKPINLPERRFSLTTGADSETARLWSNPPHLFEKLQGSAFAHWFPQAQSDTYEATQQFRAAHTFGTAPFDDLYLLGMERDTDLDLRGHIGTRDGRKGSSPLGYHYFLSNTDFSRRIYGNGLFAIKAGPLLDIAKVSAPTTGLSTRQWLFDAGIEAKLTVFRTSVVLSYGRDLRTGNNAFYGTLAR
jgi:tetratricopeptide (TPR) repeat protein